MYLWKCWRDTRNLFIVATGVTLVAMPLSVLALGSVLTLDLRPSSVASMASLITVLAAFGFGALAASEQFAGRTIQFLFTKPRRRSYFVWANWAVGCAELVAVAAINFLVGWIVLARYANNPASTSFRELLTTQPVFSIVVYAVFIYSLTYALTAALRNGLYGLGASIVAISIPQAAAILARVHWKILLPVPPGPIGSLSPALSGALWVIVALLFVLGAHLLIDRAEF